MASHEGSRKRLKTSREGKQAIHTPPMASTSAIVDEKRPNSAPPPTTQCHHEQALKTLHTDIEAMRDLVTCKICDRLLYEPYALSCGHTFCYSCLNQWLPAHRKKTCPDCRAVITQQPTPSYIIRELVLVFVSRSELLPDGETSEEHNKYVKEEAEIVSKDKANTDRKTGGLFKGCFTRGKGPHLLPIHDPGDGVDRCPACHWELEDGFCNQCGEHVGEQDHLGFSDYDDESDTSDDEVDHELDMDDAAEVWGADMEDNFGLDGGHIEDVPYPPQGNRYQAQHTHGGARRTVIDLDSASESDEEEDEDEEDPTMRDFIAEDDHESDNSESDESNETDVPQVTTSRRITHRRPPHIIISDDEAEVAAPSSAAGATAGSDEESEEGPIVPGNPRRKRTVRRQRLARTLESEPSSSEDEEEEEDYEPAFRPGAVFSPPHLNDDVTGDETSEHSDDEESDHRSSIHPMHDDDDDESDESDDEDGYGGLSLTHICLEPTLTNCIDTRAETPRNVRRPSPSFSHRLQPLGQRSNRHADMPTTNTRVGAPAGRASQPGRTLQDIRVGRETGQYAHLFERGWDLAGAAARASQPGFNISRAAPRMSAPSMPVPNLSAPRMSAPSHPFHLSDTLANINYNQRNQQARSNPNQRNVSTGSSRSSNGGGVQVNSYGSSGSSGSSRTIGQATSSRRKRALSISSDDSVE